MTDKRYDELDALLEHALAGYTPDAPRLGFEDRLRARLAAEAKPVFRGRWAAPRWVWATCGSLAGLAVLAALLVRIHVPAGGAQAAHEAGRPPMADASGPAHPGAATNSQPVPAFTLHHVSFRTKRIGSSQRQLIAQLLANGPEAIASLAREADQEQKPIEVQPIPDDPLVIKPIETPPIDDNPAEPGTTK
jgi:hypothetical protein